MPTYVYEIIRDDDQPGETFEVVQAMSDSPLKRHPETGEPVRRVILAPNIAGKWTSFGAKAALSDKNLARTGLTKYVKSGDGKYEKAAGSGPDTLSAD